MAASHILVTLLCFCMLSTLVINVQARYLPTRSQEDRLDKLRELLRDLLETELGRAEYQQEVATYNRPNERKLFYKRDVSSQH